MANKDVEELVGIGHNSGGEAADQLRAFIERLERLQDEKTALAADMKDVFAEAKGSGFDVKVMRRLLTIRRRDATERAEEEAVLELYMQALGMI